jgi:hypothetical protein
MALVMSLELPRMNSGGMRFDLTRDSLLPKTVGEDAVGYHRMDLATRIDIV